ncbi:hypothetical protein [Haloterrigena alkaliphila]|uniref:Uncharacterized protein n=1 Tax=Haloterrigena alkaliphila TaxID=2816475 RepID=A0A8A2VDC2_9EURY|nr:hypothetical protein [Haloterrigena alkaliphila]QSW98687.1 hypothetical protein J0X25_15010 [Haloterrigena alkaliphila]
MTDRSRRTVLCGTAGLVALTAGCLDQMGTSGNGENDDGNGDSPSDDGPGSAGSDGESDDGTGSSSLETYDATAFTRNKPVDPAGTLFVDADRADSWLAERGLDEEEYLEFVADTVFDDSVLLALEAEAPQLNYELALETVAVDAPTEEGRDGDGDHEGTLTIEAAVTETSDDEGSSDVGGTQMISVGQLVRATFDGEPLTEASVTIVGHDGTSHEFGMAVDSSSESAPEPDEDA